MHASVLPPEDPRKSYLDNGNIRLRGMGYLQLQEGIYVQFRDRDTPANKVATFMNAHNYVEVLKMVEKRESVDPLHVDVKLMLTYVDDNMDH